MKIRWKLKYFDGLHVIDQDDEGYEFIIRDTSLFISGNINSSSSRRKYLKIKERMKITFWI